MNDKTQPPQGVMAELRELLAKEQAAKREWYESRNTLGQEYRDWSMANRRLSDAALDALPCLLDEVEALRAKVTALYDDGRAEHAARTALLARCEGLEAKVVEWHEFWRIYSSLNEPSQDDMNEDRNRVLDEMLAATRTTGD